jgi:hypothetical protein
LVLFSPVLILSILIGPPLTADDLGLMAAVEEFAQATPPEPFRRLIPQLGAACWQCREIASRKLARASLFDQRWLFCGRKHLDREIGLRCNAILRRLNVCRTCQGRGETAYQWASDYYHACEACAGWGSFWRWTPWD